MVSKRKAVYERGGPKSDKKWKHILLVTRTLISLQSIAECSKAVEYTEKRQQYINLGASKIVNTLRKRH